LTDRTDPIFCPVAAAVASAIDGAFFSASAIPIASCSDGGWIVTGPGLPLELFTVVAPFAVAALIAARAASDRRPRREGSS
jgi:hypothetical protein